jgi:Tfp pilus assembly protein PilV
MRALARTTRRSAPRGISLIEALVAMAVMAFGMLGVVGMQATLRGNADLSKQRTEAMRIAQERMEDLRNFSVLTDPTATNKAFDTKATFAATTVTGYTTNTTYTVSGSVLPSAAAPMKTLTVTVTWNDRAGTAQNVQLMSAMAQVAPELGASLVVSAQGYGAVRNPEGRRRGIPPQAKNFGDGTSGFRLPGINPTGVTWVFNNVTGLITSLCTTSAADNATLTLVSLSGCVTTQSYQFVSGYIRYDATTPPTATSIANPAGTVPSTIEAEVDQTLPTAATIGCQHDRTVPTYTAYFCAVPVLTPAPATWSGNVRIKASTLPTLSATLADTAAGNHKVCRLPQPGEPVTPPTPIYQNINTPRANENLTLIVAGNGTVAYACPNPPLRAAQPTT